MTSEGAAGCMEVRGHKRIGQTDRIQYLGAFVDSLLDVQAKEDRAVDTGAVNNDEGMRLAVVR